MTRKKQLLLIAFLFTAIGSVQAQINTSKQLSEIPGTLTRYVDGYMHDMTNYQGVAYLNSLHTSGRVLGKWELNFSINLGAGISTFANSMPSLETDNFKLSGEAPTLFGSGDKGELFFQIVDDTDGLPLYDPFTGEKVGFGIPLLPGAGLDLGIAPSVMPVVSMGLGFGTEVSVSYLPGALKASTKSLTEDLNITKDNMLSLGIRHDLFHWIPALANRNLNLTIGANYNTMALEAALGSGLLDAFENSGDGYVTATNNLTGIEYGFTSLGFEAILSKKLGIIDFSLFASTNQSDYYLKSKGSISIDVATDFYNAGSSAKETTTLTNLVDIEGTTSRFLYGAGLQMNLGRLFLGVKGAYGSELYVSTTLGFKLRKNKKVVETIEE